MELTLLLDTAVYLGPRSPLRNGLGLRGDPALDELIELHRGERPFVDDGAQERGPLEACSEALLRAALEPPKLEQAEVRRSRAPGLGSDAQHEVLRRGRRERRHL